jgi:pimeloyl-ACP methyl ester carboxylesterase
MRPLFALLLMTSACVHSYRASPPLEFRDVPYTSLDGTAWPERQLTLDGVGDRYKLGTKRHIAVVELNPEGKRTLVFLHGLGSSLKFWRYQLDLFARDGYHVVAFDQLGYGKSDKPAEFSYSMEAMSEVVDEAMGALGIEHAVLVGHSMGGEVAMVTALRFPTRVEALVLTSPAGFEAISKREKRWFAQVFSSSFVKAAPEYAIWGSVRAANFMRWRSDLEWLVEERVRLAKGDGFDAYAYAQVRSVDGLTHNDFVRDNLKSIAVPALIIFGEDDRLIPNPYLHGGRARGVMEWGAAQLPSAKLIGLKGCGHTVQMDCPDDYNPAVQEFLGVAEK